MKKLLPLFILNLSFLFMRAQELPLTLQQQFENQAEGSLEELDDDSWLQDLDQFHKDRININTADADELRQLQLLTELQLDNLLAYRRFLGEFISLYELQAVPGWDPGSIRKIIPYLTIRSGSNYAKQLEKRMVKGEYSLITRVSQILEKADGYKDLLAGRKYPGSPQHIFLRLRYNYKNLLQWGVTGDKDAGENFFRGRQRMGFDLYSFHFFIRKMGWIRTLALGDFTVNMGQGLIQWQAMAFKKTADVINSKRQSEILRPYSSSGEFYFNRGAGITLARKCLSLTAFVSYRRLSGNYVRDSLTGESFISSLQISGYHRTTEENRNRNNTGQLFYGASLGYERGRSEAGFNFVQYNFSLPLKRREDPYNLYAFNGNKWCNASIDYGYTIRNLHAYGEFATDKLLNKAFMAGFLLSADRRVDLSFLYRNISSAYQAINGNAFTEATLPSNEKGCYVGISIKPAAAWKIDAYADVFTFPWLRYRVDAASYGKDILCQFQYIPDKQTEICLRYHQQSKEQNESSGNTNMIALVPRGSVRLHISKKINNSISLRQRVEFVSYDKRGRNEQKGFLCFADMVWQPLLKPYGGLFRWQYFDTDGYDSRIYAYENDLLYSFSIPAFSGKGIRYYVMFNWDLTRKLTLWFRLSQTILQGLQGVGDGPDRIGGNKKTEAKFQLRCLF